MEMTNWKQWGAPQVTEEENLKNLNRVCGESAVQGTFRDTKYKY